jgi:hypothetical protein
MRKKEFLKALKEVENKIKELEEELDRRRAEKLTASMFPKGENRELRNKVSEIRDMREKVIRDWRYGRSMKDYDGDFCGSYLASVSDSIDDWICGITVEGARKLKAVIYGGPLGRRIFYEEYNKMIRELEERKKPNLLIGFGGLKKE